MGMPSLTLTKVPFSVRQFCCRLYMADNLMSAALSNVSVSSKQCGFHAACYTPVALGASVFSDKHGEPKGLKRLSHYLSASAPAT